MNYIFIKKYKLFENLELKFDKINIITGPNNIGKTSLLEAIYINFIDNPTLFTKIINQLYKSRYSKNIKDIKTLQNFIETIGDIYISSDKNKIDIKLIDENLSNNLIINFKNKKLKTKFDEISIKTEYISNINFISGCFRDDMIIDMYENILLENREEEIDKLLSQYDNNIKKFKILPKKDEAIVVLENGKNLSINEVGDGFKRYLLLLLLLYNSKDGMLLVDEIENGIWYKNLPLVLSVISNLSKSLNIQLFMTTHSKDVIENLDIFDSFYLIEFKSRDKIITYDKNSFLIEVKNGFEVRG